MGTVRPILAALLLLVAAGCSRSPSPGTITAEQAAAHVGETVTVEGIVTEVHTARSRSATFIDMGGEYPDNAFAGVIFASDMGTVGDLSDLTGKTIDINGTVRLYDGRAEIVISSQNQIKER